MFAKTAVALCLQLALFNVAYTQVVNRVPLAELQNLIANNVIPFGPNVVSAGPCGNVVPIGPQILPVGPQILPVGPQIIPVGPQIVPCGPNVVESVVSPLTVPAATTIIQDSSIANNLANTLQLLVVSNLLSNTLPTASPPVEILSPLGLNGLGYSYVY